MGVFWWIVVRSESAIARYMVSSSTPSSVAYTMTGTEAVIPWFPLPELMITGSSHPFIRASDPAAAMENFRQCLARINSPARYEAFLRCGYPVLLRDDARTPEQTMALAAERFGLTR